MAKENNKLETILNLFEGKEIRSIWDAEKEDYYFSVVDVIRVLTDSKNPNDYWYRLKNRMTENVKKEEIESLGIKTSTMLDDKNEEYFPFNGEYPITFKKCIDDSLGTRANIEDTVKEALKEKWNDTRELPYLQDYFTKEEYDYM